MNDAPVHPVGSSVNTDRSVNSFIMNVCHFLNFVNVQLEFSVNNII